MGSESRSKGKKSNSKQRKEPKRGSERGRSSSSGSSSSRSKKSRSKRSESRSNRDRGSRYQGGYQRRQPEKVQANAKLFVTNIDSKFSQEELDRDLRSLFQPYGAIKDIIVKTKQGSSNSYCFIQYQDIDAAAKAQEELKGKQFKGKELKVEFGRGQRKTQDRKSDKCYICHKEGHFAKQCRFNRFTGSSTYATDDRGRRDDKERVRERDYRDRDYDRDRDYRDKDRRDHRRRKYSRSSSSSKSYRKHDRSREDYRRRDSHRSPEKRSSNYHSSNPHRY